MGERGIRAQAAQIAERSAVGHASQQNAALVHAPLLTDLLDDGIQGRAVHVGASQRPRSIPRGRRSEDHAP